VGVCSRALRETETNRAGGRGQVCNFCDMVLQVAALTRQGNPVWLDTVAPQGYVCLPTTLASCYALILRPAPPTPGEGEGEGLYDWCDGRVLLPLRSQPSSVDWSLVSCPATRDSPVRDGRALRVRVDAKRAAGDEGGGASGGGVRCVVSVHPIFRVRNALPQPISASLLLADVQERSEQALETANVAAGAVLFLYSAELCEAPLRSRSALGLVVSSGVFLEVVQPALIFHPEGHELSSSITLLDPRGQALCLGVAFETDKWGDTTVVVHPQVPVFCHSSITLRLYGVLTDVVERVCLSGAGR
jgi:hypothetical protein